MADKTTTLRQVLCQKKPFLPCTSTSYRNTSNGGWPWLQNNVVIWDEFNLNTLNESYGHVLDFAVAEPVLTCPQADQMLGGLVMHKADDMNHLTSWNGGMMGSTLQFAKACLGLCPGVVLRQQYSSPDKLLIPKLPGASARLIVDHIVSLDDFPEQPLVIGLGRLSSKWSGRELAYHLDNTTHELLWPVRQLANLCQFGQTRYGYIQTDQELVVCCFSQEAEGAEKWKAAIMPIPWTRNGVDVLTTDLALWWLCMLAMSARHHRAIVPEREMVKINAWDTVYIDAEHGWVRRHRYSGVDLPTNPPSQGNATAIEAHVNSDFDVDPTADDPLDSFFDSDAPNGDAPNGTAG
ncbi:hypothetical protein E5D57_008064 [Metarhizium anisopliae]|nr:hypothetical protein E5D57_008064 [Metarhizium anisopliae]